MHRLLLTGETRFNEKSKLSGSKIKGNMGPWPLTLKHRSVSAIRVLSINGRWKKLLTWPLFGWGLSYHLTQEFTLLEEHACDLKKFKTSKLVEFQHHQELHLAPVLQHEVRTHSKLEVFKALLSAEALQFAGTHLCFVSGQELTCLKRSS